MKLWGPSSRDIIFSAQKQRRVVSVLEGILQGSMNGKAT